MADKPESELIEGIGKRIRSYREDMKLSRNHVAERLGVSLSTLQAWENEEREPTASYVLKLSDILESSVEKLLTGDDASSTKVTSLNVNAGSNAVAIDVKGNTVDLEEFVFVPRYNVSAAAGYGAYNDDESPMFTVSFRRY